MFIIDEESSLMLHHVALVRSNVSEGSSASIIRVTRIGELGTMVAVTSNGQMLLTDFCNLDDGGAVSPNHRFLQQPWSVTSKNTAFSTVTTVRTADL
jgi:hypothetical protein